MFRKRRNEGREKGREEERESTGWIGLGWEEEGDHHLRMRENESAYQKLLKFQIPFPPALSQASARGPRRDNGNDIIWSYIFIKFAKVNFFVFFFC